MMHRNGAKPLEGKNVLITRSQAQANDFVKSIEALGGQAYHFPMIKMVPPSNTEELDRAIQRIESYHWIIFTSVNGVSFFVQRMRDLGLDPKAMVRANIVAVGPRTAKILNEYGLEVKLLPKEFLNEGILEVLKSQVKSGEKVLLPRADIAREILPQELRRLSLEVTEVDAYETVIDRSRIPELVELLQDHKIHIATFTSPSTIKNFMTVVQEEGILNLLKGIKIACIGPITAKTAENLGLQVNGIAEEYTIDGLIEVLKRL